VPWCYRPTILDSRPSDLIWSNPPQADAAVDLRDASSHMCPITLTHHYEPYWLKGAGMGDKGGKKDKEKSKQQQAAKQKQQEQKKQDKARPRTP
jgi:hypothetical protein